MDKKIKFQKLYKLMKEKGITQKQLAEMIGIDPIKFHYRLYGIYEFRMKEIKKLLEIFNVSFSDLFPEIED